MNLQPRRVFAIKSGMMVTDQYHYLPPDVHVIDDLLSLEECHYWIAKGETLDFETAPISTEHGFELISDVRNNGRIMFDDEPLAADLWSRLRGEFAWIFPGRWKVHGLNERFRLYRYRPGQYFRWHGDGSFVRNEAELSLLSLIIYLNCDFEGGTTEFEEGIEIEPAAGRALLFYHPLLHQGARVTAGTKYVLRTDVMYRRV